MSKTQLNKRDLVYAVARRLQHRIHYLDVGDIVSSFFDEFMQELITKRSFRIPNFCTFKIEATKPRLYHHIQTRKIEMSTGKPLLKAKLVDSLSKQIAAHADLFKTLIPEK